MSMEKNNSIPTVFTAAELVCFSCGNALMLHTPFILMDSKQFQQSKQRLKGNIFCVCGLKVQQTNESHLLLLSGVRKGCVFDV